MKPQSVSSAGSLGSRVAIAADSCASLGRISGASALVHDSRSISNTTASGVLLVSSACAS
jgi:hypothetical protein